MEGFTEIAKALADENRARIMMFLQDRELCVCQIMKMLGLAPSTVSKHLDILYRAGLVLAQKRDDGFTMIIRVATLAPKSVAPFDGFSSRWPMTHRLFRMPRRSRSSQR